MPTVSQLEPTRVDPAVVALQRVAAESKRLREAIDALDEAGGPGRALQVDPDVATLRRTVGQLKETRSHLNATLGRLAGLVRAGVVAIG